MHLDEAIFHSNTAEAVMTPYCSAGEVNHLPGAITMGVLQDIGWNISNASTQNQGLNETLGFHVFPNPVYDKTTISVNLRSPSFVYLDIFDFSGSKIKTVLAKNLGVGIHDITIKTNDLTTGIYFCQMTTGSFFSQRKLIIIKE